MTQTVYCGKALDLLATLPDASIDLIYIDPPFATQKDRGDFDDRWPSVEAFIQWLKPHVLQSKRVLKPSGNFVLHLDYRAFAYAKVMSDNVFGYDNFMNEIVWCYASGGASKRWLARKHDNLGWWVKDPSQHTFNVTREPYATPNVKGRKGFHADGRMLNDWWTMSIISTTAKERLGYDSQKPEKLMERVVEVFSNPGDTVLDFFCGSGTTAKACLTLGRDGIFIDKNPDAAEMTAKRVGTSVLNVPKIVKIREVNLPYGVEMGFLPPY